MQSSPSTKSGEEQIIHLGTWAPREPQDSANGSYSRSTGRRQRIVHLKPGTPVGTQGTGHEIVDLEPKTPATNHTSQVWGTTWSPRPANKWYVLAKDFNAGTLDPKTQATNGTGSPCNLALRRHLGRRQTANLSTGASGTSHRIAGILQPCSLANKASVARYDT